jgi:hypothetical protein
LSVASSRRPPSTLSYPVTSATHFHKKLRLHFLEAASRTSFPSKVNCAAQRERRVERRHTERAEATRSRRLTKVSSRSARPRRAGRRGPRARIEPRSFRRKRL